MSAHKPHRTMAKTAKGRAKAEKHSRKEIIDLMKKKRYLIIGFEIANKTDETTGPEGVELHRIIAGTPNPLLLAAILKDWQSLGQHLAEIGMKEVLPLLAKHLDQIMKKGK